MADRNLETLSSAIGVNFQASQPGAACRHWRDLPDHAKQHSLLKSPVQDAMQVFDGLGTKVRSSSRAQLTL
jgi:hypothetical protein